MERVRLMVANDRTVARRPTPNCARQPPSCLRSRHSFDRNCLFYRVSSYSLTQKPRAHAPAAHHFKNASPLRIWTSTHARPANPVSPARHSVTPRRHRLPAARESLRHEQLGLSYSCGFQSSRRRISLIQICFTSRASLGYYSGTPVPPSNSRRHCI